MKRSIIYIFITSTLFIAACNGNKTNNVQVTGLPSEAKGDVAVFTIDGTSIKGKVSTQYFGSDKADNFSILCQQDEPLYLLQATFANEKEVKSDESLKPKGGSYKVNVGEYGLTLTTPETNGQFIANSKSTGTLKVNGNNLVIAGLTLYNSDGKEKKISGTIPF
jgi:hypothetical protein